MRPALWTILTRGMGVDPSFRILVYQVGGWMGGLLSPVVFHKNCDDDSCHGSTNNGGRFEPSRPIY